MTSLEQLERGSRRSRCYPTAQLRTTTPTTTPSASASGCRFQELREAAGFTKYGLVRESGVSREYIGKIERGVANPTVPVAAYISHGLGMTMTRSSERLEG